MRIRPLAAGLAAVALTLTACGDDDSDTVGSAAPANGPAADSNSAGGTAASGAVSQSAAAVTPRRVELQMADISFSPASIDVKVGETVSFVFTNTGKIPHDAFLGDTAAQEEHEAQMKAMTDPNDHGGHEGGITVAAGQTGAIRQTFDKPGPLEIGCHQPGHYAAGMKVTINVT